MIFHNNDNKFGKALKAFPELFNFAWECTCTIFGAISKSADILFILDIRCERNC